MNKFFTDYVDMVYNPQMTFIRKHKLGYALITAGAFFVGCGIPYIKFKIEEKERMGQNHSKQN